MPRLSVRRSRSMSETIALAAGGLVAGFAAGFIAAGLVGPVRRERVARAVSGWREGKPDPVTATGAAAAIREALKAAQGLADQNLRVIPVTQGRVELHGWVDNRREGARALRLARESAPDAQVIGRLRVRGEDEDLIPSDRPGEPQPA